MIHGNMDQYKGMKNTRIDMEIIYIYINKYLEPEVTSVLPLPPPAHGTALYQVWEAEHTEHSIQKVLSTVAISVSGSKGRPASKPA